ncbi:MAG: type II toxin-antitoxin system ParD family antitoxin [Thermomicrobiales bacterium]
MSLTPKLEALVREKVASGMYNNASEVVREGLRLIDQRDQKLEKLRSLIREGFDQVDRGEYVVVDDDYFERVLNNAEEIVRKEQQEAVSNRVTSGN